MDAKDGRFGERLTPCSFVSETPQATPERYPCHDQKSRISRVKAPRIGWVLLRGRKPSPSLRAALSKWPETQGFYLTPATAHARAFPCRALAHRQILLTGLFAGRSVLTDFQL